MKWAQRCSIEHFRLLFKKLFLNSENNDLQIGIMGQQGRQKKAITELLTKVRFLTHPCCQRL